MIGVLTSGIALGVHVPGLLLAQRLREYGSKVEVYVLEQLLPDSKRAVAAKTKATYHRDFRLALAGQRLKVDPSAAVSEETVRRLAEHWRERDIRRLVVFSGFWLPIVKRAAAAAGIAPQVDVCHVDSVPSPSFCAVTEELPVLRHRWLADAAHSTLPCTIPVTRRAPVRWTDRDRRLLVHGGGWGMGTYRQRAAELRSQGFMLDIVAYEASDTSTRDDGIRYFMIDPSWHPWMDDGYPPFGLVGESEEPAYRRGEECHGSFELARSALAMVSKPGGGTLLDSLWSQTPLVLLEPFGEHEARNAELWEKLGFGVSLARWKEFGFSPEILEESHEALRGVTDEIPDYARALAEEIS